MPLPPEMSKELVESSVPMIKRMGLQALVMEPGHIKLMAPLEGNGNHIGTMYAGALYCLAEVTVGAFWLTTWDVEKFFPVIKEMNIKYLALATTDITVELTLPPGEGERIAREAGEKGKCQFVLECELKDTAGQVVATTAGTYQLRLTPKK